MTEQGPSTWIVGTRTLWTEVGALLREFLGGSRPKIAFAISSLDARLLWSNLGVPLNNVFDLQVGSVIAF